MSASVPLLRAVVVQIAAAFLERTGARVERLLERVGLPRRALEDAEAMVSFPAAARFLEEGALREGIEDLGLRLGATSRVQQLGTFGALIGRAFTLHEALASAYRNFPGFSSGERAWLSREGRWVHLHHRFLPERADGWRQTVGLSLALHLNLVRDAAGPEWRPAAVWVPARDLSGCRALPLLSDTRIEFGKPEMRVTFPADVLHLPLSRRTADAKPIAANWEESAPASDTSGAVRQLVGTLLRDGYPNIHLVADSVRMSARTLQRRLQEEGVTFVGVVARARLDAAQRLLDDPARKVIDVALDLGYSDPAHFTRAFARWTGLTPRQFRRLRSSDRRVPASP